MVKGNRVVKTWGWVGPGKKRGKWEILVILSTIKRIFLKNG